MKQFPFSLKFSIPAILLIFGTVLVGAIVQRETVQSFRRVEKDVSDNARFAGDRLSGMLEYLYRRGDVEQAEVAISKMRNDVNLRLSVLYDEKNRVLLATRYELRDRALQNTPAANRELTFTQVRETLSGQILLSEDKQKIWAIYPVPLKMMPGELRPSRIGTLWLEYDLSLLKQRALRDALQRSLSAAVGLGIFCIAIWFFFEKTLTRRAAKLVAASHNFAKGELSIRAKIGGSDELAQIAKAFNQMAKRIQADTETLQASEIALKQANETLENRVRERTASLKEQKEKLEQTLQELQQAQAQLVQQEKMSSLGQLVAGIAHEINNPVNFIHGNITHTIEYAEDLLKLIELYRYHCRKYVPEIESKIEEIDLDFLSQDLSKILTSMKVGTERIRNIVLSLRTFSRMDESEFKTVDLHAGIDSTLLILQHRFRGNNKLRAIEIVKEYGMLPLVDCFAGQLNQVFMNILANGIEALEESRINPETDSPQIRIRTSVIDKGWVEIAIADNGMGIPESVQPQIFNPFFTTKPIGKGTGMGLAIAYQIVTERHSGKLRCCSTPGKGTELIIQIQIGKKSSKIEPFKSSTRMAKSWDDKLN
ncbi:ATP-binding protein [Lusitaniella coriacea]|uniref:sensor histidine kinase n=1 Tax=Lusitaniella coriacea TaxID=1983105 RepID=UPI003CFA1D9C